MNYTNTDSTVGRHLTSIPVLARLQWIMEQPGYRKLGLIDHRVLLVLLLSANHQTGECWPGMKTIAGRAGTDEYRAGQSIRKLTELNFIETKIGGGRHNPNRYIVAPHAGPWFEEKQSRQPNKTSNESQNKTPCDSPNKPPVDSNKTPCGLQKEPPVNHRGEHTHRTFPKGTIHEHSDEMDGPPSGGKSEERDRAEDFDTVTELEERLGKSGFYPLGKAKHLVRDFVARLGSEAAEYWVSCIEAKLEDDTSIRNRGAWIHKWLTLDEESQEYQLRDYLDPDRASEKKKHKRRSRRQREEQHPTRAEKKQGAYNLVEEDDPDIFNDLGEEDEERSYDPDKEHNIEGGGSYVPGPGPDYRVFRKY